MHYILFYKPFGVLSQFTPEGNHATLKDFGPFPRDVYPVGRLDVDSEGLLLMTNDNIVKHRLTDPRYEHRRTYLVQVEHIPSAAALEQLVSGVMVEGRMTRPAQVLLLPGEPPLPPRPVPVRYRKNVPTVWLELALREGRNRQVRKMTAAIGCPTLRLVRTRIETLTLDGMEPGEARPLAHDEKAALLDLVGTK